MVIAECKIVVVGRIVETVCVTDWHLAIICGFPPIPVTVVARTGALKTVGAVLIWEPLDELVASQAVP